MTAITTTTEDALTAALAAPTLSMALPDPYGRLYRKPSAPTHVPYMRAKVIRGHVDAGDWVPSITNVLSMKNKPFLMKWAARKAAQEAVTIEQTFPGRLRARPKPAVQYLATTAERDTLEASDRGSRVHYACELLAQDLPLPDELIKESELGYIQAWKQWRDDFRPKFRHLELTVYGTTNDGLGYAGTTDFLCDINGLLVAGDIKTNRSGLHADVAYQLTAVVGARSYADKLAVLHELPPVDTAYALLLRNDGTYQFAPAVTSRFTWEVFGSLRKVWETHLLEKTEGVLGDPITEPEGVLPTINRNAFIAKNF